MAGSKRTSTQRHQSDRDAQASLFNALTILVEEAQQNAMCTCKPCMMLRDLGRSMERKQRLAGMPGELREPPASPPIRPRRSRS